MKGNCVIVMNFAQLMDIESQDIFTLAICALNAHMLKKLTHGIKGG